MSSEPKNFSEAIEEIERSTRKSLQDLEDKILKLKPELEEEVGKAKDRVENHVREQPWLAMGVVGVLFFVLGLFFGSRGSRGPD